MPDPDEDPDWDDDLDAADDSDDGDDDAGDDTTVPCPFCRHDIFEDAPRCPHCERYLSAEDFTRGAKPVWVVVTAVVCLLIAVWLAFATF
jgi:hypothetical protein